jgi:pimeloyl-ACP methyl ester carboxylesterase
MLYAASGDAAREGSRSDLAMVPRGGAFLRASEPPSTLPLWLTEDDLDFYATEFARTGFRGALANWYRDGELVAPFAGARVTMPALYIVGDQDLVLAFPGMGQLVADLKLFVPALRGSLILPGCGRSTR